MNLPPTFYYRGFIYIMWNLFKKKKIVSDEPKPGTLEHYTWAREQVKKAQMVADDSRVAFYDQRKSETD